jgi:hypothetical protein
MNTKNRHIALAAAVICAAALAGCGHDNAKTTVSYLVNHPDKIQDQQNWCGQQAHPSMIYGCRAIENAKVILRLPKMLAEVGKPQPIQQATFADQIGSLAAGEAGEEKAFAAKAPKNVLAHYQALAEEAADKKLEQQYPKHPYSEKQEMDLLYWCTTQARLGNIAYEQAPVIDSPICQSGWRAHMEVVGAENAAANWARRGSMPFCVETGVMARRQRRTGEAADA